VFETVALAKWNVTVEFSEAP